MDFVKGKVYFHKADGRRLVCLTKEGLFRYVDYRGKYLEGEFRDYEVADTEPQLINHKLWSLEG